QPAAQVGPGVVHCERAVDVERDSGGIEDLADAVHRQGADVDGRGPVVRVGSGNDEAARAVLGQAARAAHGPGKGQRVRVGDGRVARVQRDVAGPGADEGRDV